MKPFLRRGIHAEYLLCARDVSKNNHKLVCFYMAVKRPCHAVTDIVYIRVLT